MSEEGELVTVELRELPVPVHARAQEHGEALRREFRLIADQLRDHPSAGVPQRLMELTAVLSARYAGMTVEQEEQLEEAIAAGARSIDLTFRVPPSAAEASMALGAILDEADEYCRAGQHLLTLETPADLVDYRRWYLDEFVRQIAGDPPRPWPEAAAEYRAGGPGGQASQPSSGSGSRR